MHPPANEVPHLVALLGFSAFERSAMATCLRRAPDRRPGYLRGRTFEECQFAVVDAQHKPSVDRIVESNRLRSTVFIGDKPPEGATAWLPRPIDPAHVLRELDVMVVQLTQERQRAEDEASPSNARQALLVDDSEVALTALDHKLRQHGVASDFAMTSGKALEMLSRRAYPLVFIDVELGDDSELDGLALCQHLKRQHRHAGGAQAPLVVMVSAHHGEVDRARGTFAGCDAYLAKPVDDAVLQRLLHRHRDLL